MRIRTDDYQDILKYMVKQRWEGNEFVAFLNDSAAVVKEDLFCFGDHYEVKEFCYENSTDVDTYDYLAIRTVYRVMSEAMQDNSLFIERCGLIDISAMVSARIQRIEVEDVLNNKKDNFMNQKNLEYLQDQIMYSGLGEGTLATELKQNIEKGSDDFKLKHEVKFGNDTVEATLNFSKSKKSDMYFYNSYDVSLQKEGQSEKLNQTFYINYGQNITLKEAYNMLEGRSVNKNLTNKEGEQYNAWVKLDFEHTDNNGNFRIKKFGESFGYDLDAELSKHPIKELTRDDYKDDLIGSLKKGNIQSVTFIVDGADQKHFVSADPQFKTIKVYDADMQSVGSRLEKSEKVAQGESKTAKHNQKEASVTDGEETKQKAKKSNRLKA